MHTTAYPIPTSTELAGPWRRAALVAVGIAALELVALIVAIAALVATPLTHRSHSHAAKSATAPVAKPRPAPVRAHALAPTTPPLPRSRTHVLVLNGNGTAGAAHTEATTLLRHGYRIAATGNAERSDYATTIVLYRPGFGREARRLSRDTGVAVVAALDGLPVARLHGAQLVVILGR